MSAALAVAPAPVAARKSRARSKPRRFSKTPSHALRGALGRAAEQAAKEGASYRDVKLILRAFLVREALVHTRGDKTAAGKRLGLSRDLVRAYRQQAKDLGL